MLLLRGKVVLITGAAKGLGRAMALFFAAQGAIVVAHYHASEREAKTLEQRLQKKNPKSMVVAANLRDHDATRAMIENAQKRFGRIDVLIHNVGSFVHKPIIATTVEEFSDVIETNLTAAFHLASLVLPQMQKRKRGQVIFFGCAGADRMTIRPLTTPYFIAKTGVLMLTKSLAAAVAKDGVHVNTISPGVLPTGVLPTDYAPRRRTTDRDILNAVEFFLSSRSSHVTGANIEVTGGWIP
jgi:NAD(P)-dependent dehydrogenase (short-subunit alcohol dehydrogenase family)